MNHGFLDPRIAALWIAHGQACANLLRAHGRAVHADNYEAALDALTEILAAEVGTDALSAQIDSITDDIWSRRISTATPATRN